MRIYGTDHKFCDRYFRERAAVRLWVANGRFAGLLGVNKISAECQRVEIGACNRQG